MKKCEHSCNVYYLLAGRPMCLHKLFDEGYIKAITREKTREGVEFYIFSDKVKRGRWGWQLDGRRTRLHEREQILLAIELAEKHKNNVKRIRL